MNRAKYPLRHNLTCLLILPLLCLILAGRALAGSPEGPPPPLPSVRWVKHSGNPVLDVGPAGSWDAAAVGLPSVLAVDGGYMMWYSGGGAASERLRIGLATSSDGLGWQKSPNGPVLAAGPAGSWDSGVVTAPAVLYHDGLYRMWYRGTDDPVTYLGAAIGYATSPDGLRWTKSAANPVLTAGAAGAWDGEMLWSASVIAEAGGYKMWYSARNAGRWRIGYATSPDGSAWTKAGAPVLDLGPAGAWDDATVYYPSVVRSDGAYRMWYTGFDGSRYRIGAATSSDGVAWTRDPVVPVITPGAPGSWDGQATLAASVVAQADSFRMWFTGYDAAGIFRVGAATTARPSFLPLIRR